MNRLEDILNMAKFNDILGKKEEEKKKKCNTVLWVFAVVGAITVVAGAAYALYRYFTPDYLEDFEDDFEDEFDDDDDDLFDDEELSGVKETEAETEE